MRVQRVLGVAVKFVGGAALVAGTLVATAVMAEAQTVESKTSHKGASAATASAPNAEEAAIRAGAKEFEQAFNRSDAKAVAAFWAEDGEFVDETGREFVGRAAIEKEYAAMFANHPGATIAINVESIKFLTPEVALEQGTTRGQSPSQPSGPPVKYTAVQVKRDGKWQMLDVSETRPAMPSGAQTLAPLGWMVGQWKATFADDKAYQMSCAWMPEKSFLRRTFTVTQGDKTLSSGTQIIGWSPTLGQIVSWTFDSTGGFGHEMWEERSDAWRIFASSTLPDGSTSLSTNLMTKNGDDAFSWRSIDRSLNEQQLPDTTEVRVERVSQ